MVDSVASMISTATLEPVRPLAQPGAHLIAQPHASHRLRASAKVTMAFSWDVKLSGSG